MKNATLSVTTVNYNNRSGLVRTVESVLAQTYQNIELVVVDGGSTDGSADYLYDIRRPTIRSISERDRGIYHAMQKGLLSVQGDAVIFLNSGDWFFDERTLERIVERVDITKAIVLGRTAQIFGEDTYIRPRLESLGMLIKYPAHQGVIVPAHVARAVDFDERLYISADTDWVIKCLRRADYVLLPSIISYFELGGVSNSATPRDLKNWVLEARGAERMARSVKACAKLALRYLVGPRWFYRILAWRKYEFHQ